MHFHDFHSRLLHQLTYNKLWELRFVFLDPSRHVTRDPKALGPQCAATMSSKTPIELPGDQNKVRKRAQSGGQQQGTNIEGHRKRNLANQRNYRNRQKQYVEELEQKLRQYEREGVAATETIQQAARRVQHENAELRRMMEMHTGWSQAEIDYRLAHAPIHGTEIRAHVGHSSDLQAQPAWSHLPQHHNRMSAFNGQQGHSDRSTIASASSDQPPTPKDTISCEDAAAILADFRCQGDVDLIRGELGCAPLPEYQCSISHRDLFARMADST
jgi:hypothetical protein